MDYSSLACHKRTSAIFEALIGPGPNGKTRFSAADILRIARDPAAPPLVAVCARLLVTARSDPRRWSVGRDGKPRKVHMDPEPARAFERIADRLEGRPLQSVAMSVRRERTPSEIAAELSRILTASPHLRELIAPHLATLPALPEGGAVPPRPGAAAGEQPGSYSGFLEGEFGPSAEVWPIAGDVGVEVASAIQPPEGSVCGDLEAGTDF